MGMSPTVDRKESKSQATPFAEDFIAKLRGQLSGDAFGTGVGPLQQQAGTAIQQFVSGGGGQFDLNKLFGGLEEQFQRETDRGASEIREGFGSLGGRFGTPLAREEGRFRRESLTDFMTGIEDMLRQEHGSQQDRLLQGIGLMGQLGGQSIEPFMKLAQMGILPDELLVGPSKFSQLTGGLGDLLGGAGSLLKPTP